MMRGPRYQQARLQSNFYRDQFRRLVRWLTIELMIIAILVAIILYAVFFPPAQLYYANTTDGRVLPFIGQPYQLTSSGDRS